MARVDHCAYRVKDRKKAAEFFTKAFGYSVQTEFDLDFGNNDKVKCIALSPPEKLTSSAPWVCRNVFYEEDREYHQEYHLAPEIFISDGDPDTIVGKWVAAHGPGIHHIAYQVDSVSDKMKEWKEKGYAEFSSEEPIVCEDLIQVFSRPSELTGIVYEFIERKEFGFCQKSVMALMRASAQFDTKIP